MKVGKIFSLQLVFYPSRTEGDVKSFARKRCKPQHQCLKRQDVFCSLSNGSSFQRGSQMISSSERFGSTSWRGVVACTSMGYEYIVVIQIAFMCCLFFYN